MFENYNVGETVCSHLNQPFECKQCREPFEKDANGKPLPIMNPDYMDALRVERRGQ